MTTLFESKADTCKINPQISLFGTFLPAVQKILKQYALFNAAFLILALVEVLCCLIFFNLVSQLYLFAITLSGFLLTLFSYFTLRIYFQTKKPKQLLAHCHQTQQNILKQTEQMQSHLEAQLFVASSLTRLASALKDTEYSLYSPPQSLHALMQSFEKLSCWLHWKDLHMIKEWLFAQTIDIYINLIKQQPDNSQLHMALANTYVMLSSIYSTPPQEEISEQWRWIPAEKHSESFQHKFMSCAKRAIEEFKILNDYNPDDPWIYAQLAYSYHDLQMPQEEISAYEKIIELAPEDYDSYYKLGRLYFEQGEISKGLKLYENLKLKHAQKAANLIKHYGNYHLS